MYLTKEELIEKRKALEAIIPTIAMEIEQVPEIFHNPKDKKNGAERLDWAYSQIQNKNPKSPIGTVIINRSCVNDSLHKGFNRYKAGLYPVLDKLIENSVLLIVNIDLVGKKQFVLGSKYIRKEEIGYAGIVIKLDRDGNKYYSHTIYQKISRAARSGTGNQSQTLKLHPTVKSILHEILTVND